MSLKLTPKQYDFIYKYEDVGEIFYGGQAGGAKSEGLLRFSLRRRIECPGSQGLMLRRTYTQLETTLISKSKKIFPPFATWNESKKTWQFGKEYGYSIQRFGYSENERDVYQYDSAEFDDVCFDELGHFTEYQYLYLQSRLRSAVGGDWKTLMRAAGNPGGIGHHWIKARFVDVAREKVAKFWSEDEGLYRTRLFLPATLEDNTLMTKPQRRAYRAWLSDLPEQDKRRLRDGDWDYNPSAAFSELARDTHGYSRSDVPVPEWATIGMSFDFGFGKPFSLAWYWTDYDGRKWRFAEWYGWNGKPDEGLRMAPSQIARGILKREEVLGIGRRVRDRVADPSIFAKTPNIRGGGQGPSVGEIMAEEGVFFTPGDNDRLLGKQQMHEHLRVPERTEEEIQHGLKLPMLMVAYECEHFWRTVPSLPLDEKNIEDVDTDAEDHDYDQTRYFLMNRPIRPEREKPPESWADKIIGQITEGRAPYEELEDIYEL